MELTALEIPCQKFKNTCKHNKHRFFFNHTWLLQKNRSSRKKESHPSSWGSVLTCRWKQPNAKSRVCLHLRTTSCHQWKIKCLGRPTEWSNSQILFFNCFNCFFNSFLPFTVIFHVFYFSCRHIWNEVTPKVIEERSWLSFDCQPMWSFFFLAG